MVVGAKVCELTDGFLWFVCGLYVGILTSPLTTKENCHRFHGLKRTQIVVCVNIPFFLFLQTWP